MSAPFNPGARSRRMNHFEILTHPTQGDANQWTVYKLLDGAEWQYPALKRKSYFLTNVNKKKGTKVKHSLTFLQMLYRKVYLARCRFLHGEEVEPEDLFP